MGLTTAKVSFRGWGEMKVREGIASMQVLTEIELCFGLLYLPLVDTSDMKLPDRLLVSGVKISCVV